MSKIYTMFSGKTEIFTKVLSINKITNSKYLIIIVSGVAMRGRDDTQGKSIVERSSVPRA